MPKKKVKQAVLAASLTRVAEEKLSESYLHVIGIDEAGRGPLAGPVVAAACMIKSGVHIDGIFDSKQTTESDREVTYELLINNPDVIWGVSIVSHLEIDEVNILQATMNAMKRSIEMLLAKLNYGSKKVVTGEYVALIDGNRVPLDMPVDSKYVIKGDGSIFSIAAASIIAKVTRDRLMVALDKEYPQYNLAQHKGYPTFQHRSLLLTHGPSDIHRLTFGPVTQSLTHHGGITVFAASSGRTSKMEMKPKPKVIPASKLKGAVKEIDSLVTKVTKKGVKLAVKIKQTTPLKTTVITEGANKAINRGRKPKATSVESTPSSLSTAIGVKRKRGDSPTVSAMKPAVDEKKVVESGMRRSTRNR